MARLRFSFLLPLTLGACAATPNGDYPSLAKRPIESRFEVVESTPLLPPGPLPSDLAGKLDVWRARAAAADSAFMAALGPTEAAVAAAAGTAAPGERWIAAQQALSRLAVARGPLTDALADVDALYLARQADDAIDGMPAIAALRSELAAVQAAQDARLAALAARLGD